MWHSFFIYFIAILGCKDNEIVRRNIQFFQSKKMKVMGLKGKHTVDNHRDDCEGTIQVLYGSMKKLLLSRTFALINYHLCLKINIGLNFKLPIKDKETPGSSYSKWNIHENIGSLHIFLYVLYTSCNFQIINFILGIGYLQWLKSGN